MAKRQPRAEEDKVEGMTNRIKDRRGDTLPAPGEERRSSRSRRLHERVLVDLEVDYRADDTFLFAYITDISAMGIFVRTNSPAEKGTKLNLRFRSPSGDEIELEGEVIWVNPFRPSDDGSVSNPGMGVQFMDLTAKQREDVMKLVRTFAYLDDENEEEEDELKSS